jgi:hypothetical protein
MSTASISTNIICGGVTYSAVYGVTDESTFNSEVVCPASKAGTLSTRTGDTEGTLTLGSGHGITTGQVIDLYWTGGSRRNVIVGTVSGTSVPITAGSGDNLPLQATAVLAGIQVIIPCVFDPVTVSLIVFSVGGAGQVVYFADTVEAAHFEYSSTGLWYWDSSNLASSTFGTDDITEIRCSTSSTSVKTFKFGILSSVQ